MNNLNEKDDLAPIEIDLHMAKRGAVDESFLQQFGTGVKMLLQRMFGGGYSDVRIKGTPSEITSFAKALDKERRYMNSYIQLGLDNPKTFKNKYELDNAIKKFERITSLKWPIK